MICFHHNDMDGKAAGFCVHAWTGIRDARRAKFVEIDYKDKFPLSDIRQNEQIWIVDFSIKPHEMLQLLEITKDVTWIDHHKTSLDAYADFPHKINGLRRDGEAGCVLTWKYIHWFSDRVDPILENLWPDRERELSIANPVPRMLLLVGDRDIWAWKYGDETRYFFSGAQLHNTNPDSNFWWKCMDHEIKPLPLPNTGNAAAKKRGEEFWNKLLSDGETVERYKKSTDEEINKSLGYETYFEGHRCWAINRGRVSSDRLGDRTKQYDIVLPYVHDGKRFMVSLYSEKLDVSEIAKAHGGGGHKGAAGFVCDVLPF